MGTRARKEGQFAFTTDHLGQPVRANITHEALALFISPRYARFQPRELRRIYILHHAEIHRIAKALREERNDAELRALVITPADVDRLLRRRR